MKRQRQAAILRNVRAGGVTSQRELVCVLAREGFDVSQATVSRDLKELGLLRLRGPDGDMSYGSTGEAGSGGDDKGLRRMAPQFLLAAEPTGNMVVVKTSPGNAQGLAAVLDAARLDGVAGTVAGDDTILVVCSREMDPDNICVKLMEYALEQG